MAGHDHQQRFERRRLQQAGEQHCAIDAVGGSAEREAGGRQTHPLADLVRLNAKAEGGIDVGEIGVTLEGLEDRLCLRTRDAHIRRFICRCLVTNELALGVSFGCLTQEPLHLRLARRDPGGQAIHEVHRLPARPGRAKSATSRACSSMGVVWS